jgi:hypothetical protein
MPIINGRLIMIIAPGKLIGTAYNGKKRIFPSGSFFFLLVFKILIIMSDEDSKVINLTTTKCHSLCAIVSKCYAN